MKLREREISVSELVLGRFVFNGRNDVALRANINQLIRPHMTVRFGKIVKQPALLRQLGEAQTGNDTPTTTEQPVPVHLTAVQLWQDMEFQARDLQYQMTGSDRGGLWSILPSWEAVTDEGWQSRLGEVTGEWIGRIQEVLDPPRPRRPLNQPCPGCGEKYAPGENGKRIPAVTVWAWASDGETVAPFEQWEVTCGACGEQWHGRDAIRVFGASENLC